MWCVSGGSQHSSIKPTSATTNAVLTIIKIRKIKLREIQKKRGKCKSSMNIKRSFQVRFPLLKPFAFRKSQQVNESRFRPVKAYSSVEEIVDEEKEHIKKRERLAHG